MADLMRYVKTGNLSTDADRIIECAQRTAYKSVDSILLLRNWLLGKRIAEEELNGTDRAEYGAAVVRNYPTI